MDWPAFVEPFLGSSDKDLEFFRFNGSRSDSRLLRHSVSVQDLALRSADRLTC
jgi:hypothetical protein